MTTKTTGAEWNRFYTDPAFWPEGTWHEDEAITVDGADPRYEIDLGKLPEASLVTVHGGAVLFPDKEDGPSLEGYFKKWRKAQTAISFVVEAPKDRADEIKAAIKAAGGKVIE